MSARMTEADLKAKGYSKVITSEHDFAFVRTSTKGRTSFMLKETASDSIKPTPTEILESHTQGATFIIDYKKSITAKASADNWPTPRDGWEKEFAERLEAQKLAGDIKRWDYEPERLRVSKSTFYKPDFRVIRNDGTIVFYEVKGHFRPAAIIRMKVVIERHPYIFYIVKKKSGNWDIQEFKP